MPEGAGRRRRWTDGVDAGRNPYREYDACGVGFVAHPRQSSHRVLRLALGGLSRVAHRGATGSDRTGDGAGILTRIPEPIFRRDAARRGHPPARGRAVRRRDVLLPARRRGEGGRARREDVRGRRAAASRAGATCRSGRAASGAGPRRRGRPSVHALLTPPAGADADEWERRLYLAGRVAARRARAEGLDGFWVVSLSHRTLVYKALLTGTELKAFYPDLEDPDYATSVARLPPALLDEHAPELGARAAVPPPRAQRRDQHALGQPQRDARARARAVLAGLGRPPPAPRCPSSRTRAATRRASTRRSSSSCARGATRCTRSRC